MNRIWQEFVTCLRDGKTNNHEEAKETAKICTKGGENFRLGVCRPPNPNAPPLEVEPGVQ